MINLNKKLNGDKKMINLIKNIKWCNEEYKGGHVNIRGWFIQMIIVNTMDLNRFFENVVEYKIAIAREKFFWSIINLANYSSKRKADKFNNRNK